MKVVHVVSTPQRRGAQVFASDLVTALNGLGVDQSVAVIRPSSGPATPYEAPVQLLHGGDGVRIGPGVRRLRALLRSFDADVVQAHGGEALKFSIPAVVGLRRPVVYRRIGATPAWATTRPQRAFYGALARRASSIVAVSEVTRMDTIRTFHVDPRKTVMFPNAVDPARLRARRPRERVFEELGIASGSSVILSIGALDWEKDPVRLFGIAASVLGHVDDAVFVVAGDGPLRPELERAIARVGLSSRVRLLGVREDVPDLLAASDVFLMASGTEGMPGVVIEAGFAGVPVAAYAVGGIHEVVEQGRTGVLVRPGDDETLAREVIGLLRRPDVVRRMGEAGAARCRAMFEIGLIAPRYNELYTQLLRTQERAGIRAVR